MGKLTVVRASAGSGKTYDLCEHIAHEVTESLDPAQIMATTFTKKAAAELEGRIQAKILAADALEPRERLAKSERLELAAIGTVHSVGHQLLRRYALPLGLSPELEVLEESGSQRALDELLGELPTEPWAALSTLMARCSIENRPQQLVLKLLQAKRGNRIPAELFLEQLDAGAERLCEIVGRLDPEDTPINFDDFYALVERTIEKIAELEDATKKTAEALQKLRELTAKRSQKWADYLVACSLTAGKRSGADAALGPLRAAAASVRLQPGLHDDLRALVRHLGQQTVALEQRYRDYKEDRGLVDFTDLETLFLELLDDESLTDSLQQDFSLVVVDEFQDTNPLQLAIFQRLEELAAASRWVGDSKQAIYGFRGADPELVKGVWDAVPEENKKTLPCNYRSNAGLVQLVGALFAPLFGDDVVQKPEQPARLRGVERWVLRSKKQADDAAALAAGISQLRDEGYRLGDIAVLARTNAEADLVAEACRKIGLPVLRELSGLLLTREGALLLAGMRLGADRRDSLAAATILHLTGDPEGETPAWFSERLGEVRAQLEAAPDEGDSEQQSSKALEPWSGSPILEPLERLDPRALSPSVFVQEIITALDIPRRLTAWGDAPRRFANLDTLVALARTYEDESRQSGAVATVAGLIAHFEQLAADEKDTIRPPFGIDAVRVDTYHKAKGLEWPIVILVSLNYGRAPDLWSPVVSGGEPASRDPLAGRTIRYWPWPFGRSPYGKLKTGSGLEDDALMSDEGQAADRLQQEEARRLLYVGFTRARYHLILAHREKGYSWLDSIPEVDDVLPLDVAPGEHELEGIETNYVLRSFAGEDAITADRAEQERWLLEPDREAGAAAAVPRVRTPSSMEPPEQGLRVTIESLGSTAFPAKVKDGTEPEDLGNAIHAYFAALPSLAGLTAARRKVVADRCLRGFGVEAQLSAVTLVELGERLLSWIDAHYQGAVLRTEVAVTARRSDGSRIVGDVDLLLELDDGRAVVIDHKTAFPTPQKAEAKAAAFAGQLEGYREALETNARTVEATFIHFPFSGLMARVEVEPAGS